MNDEPTSAQEDHPHYYRYIGPVKIDFYRLCELFDITHPAQQHAMKKIMFAGQRPDEHMLKDIIEARQSLERWEEMIAENPFFYEQKTDEANGLAGGGGEEDSERVAVEVTALRAVSPRVAAVLEKAGIGRLIETPPPEPPAEEKAE